MAIITDETSLQTARAAGSALEALITMTCGRCGQTTAASQWSETPISGELPAGHFQCPKCSYAFRRKRRLDPWRRSNGELTYAPIELIEISPKL